MLLETSGIADGFGVNLYLPQQLTESDIEASIILNAILHETPISLKAVTLGIVKAGENESQFLATLDQGFSHVQGKHEGFVVSLFGVHITIGSVVFRLDRAPIQDVQTARKQWLDAKIGEAVEICFGPIDNVTYRRATDRASA